MQFLSYDDYRTHAETYGYISTWCAWDTESRQGPEHVTAASEAEYRDKGLDATLHAEVVVLALNFGASPAWLERVGTEPDKRLAYLRAQPLFENMYVPMRSRYADHFRGTCLWGAYATDFFKFDLKQSADDLPVGVPTREGGGIAPEYFTDDGLTLQIDGLKRELAALGQKDSPNFVLASKVLTEERVLGPLTDAFPSMKYTRIPHYQYRDPQKLEAALQTQVPAAHRLFS